MATQITKQLENKLANKITKEIVHYIHYNNEYMGAFLEYFEKNKENNRCSIVYEQPFNEAGAMTFGLALEISQLQELEVVNNSIYPSCSKSISLALQNNTSLLSLRIMTTGWKCLTDDDVQEITHALMHNITLKKITLDCHEKFYNGAAQSFANLLMTNTTLTHIDLSSNNIDSIGAEALANVLYTNTTLLVLNLCFNRISDEGAKALSLALNNNASLLELNLNNNNIGYNGIHAFSVNIGNNTTLTKFSIHGNYFGADYYSLNSIIDYFIQRNMELYKITPFWSPWIHSSFPCHNIVVASLVCNTEFGLYIPERIWKYIFSFFERQSLLSF